MSLTIGQNAPDFSLPDAHGKVHTLASFKGKTTVIYFYPRDNTPGCTKEACGFRDAEARLLKAGVVVVGVSPDSPASHLKFIAEQELNFTLLADPEKTMIQAYGAWGEKMMYGKISEGVIRSTVIIGADGKIAHHWAKVANAEAHPDEVLAALGL